jgi:hypothetical protein
MFGGTSLSVQAGKHGFLGRLLFNCGPDTISRDFGSLRNRITMVYLLTGKLEFDVPSI